ncbi:DUF4064 domain-containing protein [Enterococcus sp.]|uniref:DUF4064 domain-containing protein n=1 Tax=Enterococcus sp. TaxID=35783 RepID=UPI0025BEA1FF|nr:DUF4064 domain-containing protein [Enterococcus sp.]
MKRNIELLFGWIGGALAVVFLGGYTLIINQISLADFKQLFTPVFPSIMTGMPLTEALELFKSLGAWFGFTLLLVLVLIAAASLLLTYRNYRKKAGTLYLIAGICCLIGSQLLAFPIAFFFLIAGGLCFFRRPSEKAAFPQT